MVCGLRSNLVVKNQYIIDYRPQQALAERLVRWVRQVGVAGLDIGKGYREAPVETVRLALGAVVVAAADRLDAGDLFLSLQGDETIQQGVFLFYGRAGLELEQDNVLDHRRFILVMLLL